MKDLSLQANLKAVLPSHVERNLLPRSVSSAVINFGSSDYLSLTDFTLLRERYLNRLDAAPDVFGSGGSRIFTFNPSPYTALEERLKKFYGVEAALVFNSSYDANLAFFSSIPQKGDVVVYDEYIHTSMHDGLSTSQSCAQVTCLPFSHNSVHALGRALTKLLEDRPDVKLGRKSVFVVVESVYGMEGTVAPLTDFVRILERLFPEGNGHLIVDEAHAGGIYGRQGKGWVAELGLESKILAQIHSFSKAMNVTGAVILTKKLVREYLVNYSRGPLLYSACLTSSNIIAIDCVYDLLEDGTTEELSANLLNVSAHFTSFLRPKLAYIPPDVLSLPPHLLKHNPSFPPTPIVPVISPMAIQLSEYLLTWGGIYVQAITWPAVPTGQDRIRILFNANKTKKDVEKLALEIVRWAESILEERRTVSFQSKL